MMKYENMYVIRLRPFYAIICRKRRRILRTHYFRRHSARWLIVCVRVCRRGRKHTPVRHVPVQSRAWVTTTTSGRAVWSCPSTAPLAPRSSLQDDDRPTSTSSTRHRLYLLSPAYCDDAQIPLVRFVADLYNYQWRNNRACKACSARGPSAVGAQNLPDAVFLIFFGEEGALLEYLHAGPLQPCYATDNYKSKQWRLKL